MWQAKCLSRTSPNLRVAKTDTGKNCQPQLFPLFQGCPASLLLFFLSCKISWRQTCGYQQHQKRGRFQHDHWQYVGKFVTRATNFHCWVATLLSAHGRACCEWYQLDSTTQSAATLTVKCSNAAPWSQWPLYRNCGPVAETGCCPANQSGFWGELEVPLQEVL